MKKCFLFLTLAFLLNLGTGLSGIAQCPMCKASLESNQKGKETTQTYGKGINMGILFLLVIPYLAAGTIGFVYYKNYRKRKQTSTSDASK
jgi:hypothetical protein